MWLFPHCLPKHLTQSHLGLKVIFEEVEFLSIYLSSIYLPNIPSSLILEKTPSFHSWVTMAPYALCLSHSECSASHSWYHEVLVSTRLSDSTLRYSTFDLFAICLKVCDPRYPKKKKKSNVLSFWPNLPKRVWYTVLP